MYEEAGATAAKYEPLLDKNGKPVFDKSGLPLVRLSEETFVVEEGQQVVKTEPALDKKGRPVLDREGKPLYRLMQAKDGNGFPAFETVDKVYDIAKMPTSAMQRIRGKEISMIFQEPMTSLNPLFTIGNQLDEESCFCTRPARTRSSQKSARSRCSRSSVSPCRRMCTAAIRTSFRAGCASAS